LNRGINVLNRRKMLALLAVAPVAVLNCAEEKMSSGSNSSKLVKKPDDERMPVIFAAHGAPILLDDPQWMSELRQWAKDMRRPASILMISAHWENRPAAIGAVRTVPLVYDFYGFPEKFYRLTYPSPGAPALAERVRGLLRARGIDVADDPDRGLDHGAFVPLMAMYKEADIPVLQLSMPGLRSSDLIAVGKALSVLRQENVLIFASGFLTHNLRFAFQSGIPDWAREFDDWTRDALTRFDLDAIADFENRAPAARMAHPTIEHYAPLIIGAAAAWESPGKVSFPIEGFWMNGAFTKRSVQFG